MGNVLRIIQLCSREDDIELHLCKFFGCHLDRGHQSKVRNPVFGCEIINVKSE